MSFLRFLMLLALIVWIGGIIFFAFVMAPTLFTLLPARMAGTVVGTSLTKLHTIGLIAGVVFLASSLCYNWFAYARVKPFAANHVIVLTMLLLTAFSQFGITSKMRLLRSEMEPGNPAAQDIPARQAEFDRLHAWSTRLEGGVLFLGIGVVVLTARRFGNSN
jgi:uncharacterized membrane protein